MIKRTMIWAAILAGTALWPAAGFAVPAGSISGFASAALQYRVSDQLAGCGYSGGPSGNCGYMNTTGFLPYNASDGQVWDQTAASLNVAIASSVDTHGLHAQALLTLVNEPLDPGAVLHYWGSNPSSASASATWNDTLTITGPAAANMLFSFALDGNLSATGHARADAKVEWWASSSSGGTSSGQWTLSTIPAIGPNLVSPWQVTTALAIQPGDVVSLQLKLSAQAYVGCQALHGPMLCSGTAFADLGNTLKFTAISFQDGAGHDLAGYGIASANFDYSGLVNGGVPPAVPEPGTCVLFVLGLLSMARTAVRHDRRQQAAARRPDGLLRPPLAAS